MCELTLKMIKTARAIQAERPVCAKNHGTRK